MQSTNGSDARSTRSTQLRSRLEARLAVLRAQQANAKPTRQQLQQQWETLLQQEAILHRWEGLLTCHNITWSHGWWTWAHDTNQALLNDMAACLGAFYALEEG